MNRTPSTDYLAHLRKRYPAGTRVELDHMDDPYTKLRPGDQGTVIQVDDIGSVHIAWDRGSSLACIDGVDAFHTITPA
jgi:hypothetical protein